MKRIRFLCILCVLAVLCPTAAWAKLPVRSAILYNMTTGKVLYEQNADQRIPPASLTKVLSMFIAMDMVKAKKVRLNSTVRVSRTAALTGGSRMHLLTGEKISLDKLLQGMAVASGNDATMAVAQRLGTSSRNFVKLMNTKARQLGMRNSMFKTPHGLPAKGQYTTARDMLTLSRQYLQIHPQARRFHSQQTLRSNNYFIRNTNRLLGTVNGVDGLKTGYTAASGYNLIFTAKRGKTRLLGVVMGGRTGATRDAAARRLLEAGFKNATSPKKVQQSLR